MSATRKKFNRKGPARGPLTILVNSWAVGAKQEEEAMGILLEPTWGARLEYYASVALQSPTSRVLGYGINP